MSLPQPPVIRAVLFDFDATLTAPGSIDFAAIKRAIGCPPTENILEYIETLPIAEREKPLQILDRYEMEAAARSTPNAGAEELIHLLRSASVPFGIFSRNSRGSILRALENFSDTSDADFAVILSRDDAAPKPDPAGVLLAAERLGVEARSMLAVGDFVFDIVAAQRAGAPAVLLTNGAEAAPMDPPPDYVVETLFELEDVVDSLLPLSTGKLPNRFLGRFLAENDLCDPALLIAPGLGEDTAAVEIGPQDEVVVLKSDPITITSEQLGYSTVVINANDVATAGATPRWLLTTLLFPEGTNAARIHLVMSELQRVSREFGLTLCGGHTEITDAVGRPVAIGQLVGTVTRTRLIDKKQMAAGDQLLLTKGVAVEGTAVLAGDFPERLGELGLSDSTIETCQRFLHDPGISILKEAAIATDSGGVTAMHDVTEGGLATALEELSAAGGRRLRVDVDRIRVLPETRTLCDLLDIDPLGLLGSGSLLIACKATTCERLLTLLRTAGIEAAQIGEVLDGGGGVEARRGQSATEWPRFEVDEISRALRKLQG